MKIKKTILVLLNILATISFAQYGNITKSELESLKANKTYFVLDDNDTIYNGEIKRNAQKFWKLNSFELIPFSKFETLRDDKQSGFVIRVHNGTSYSTLSTQRSSADPVVGTSHYAGPQSDGLVLMMGGVTYYHHPQTATIRLPLRNWSAYAFVEDVYMTDSINYKLGSYLQIIQEYLHTLEANGKGDLGLKTAKGIYQESKHVLAKKTLLFNIDDTRTVFNYKDEALIKKLYPHSIKFVTPTEIKKAIDSQDENMLILHCLNTSGWYHYFVSEAKGGKIVYSDWFTPSFTQNNIPKMLKELAK